MAFVLLALYMFMVENLNNTEEQHKESKNGSSSCYTGLRILMYVLLDFFSYSCVCDFEIKMETCSAFFFFI